MVFFYLVKEHHTNRTDKLIQNNIHYFSNKKRIKKSKKEFICSRLKM